MAEYQMTLVDRQRIARDTVAFWLDANGASSDFRAGQHADFVFTDASVQSESDNSRIFSLASSPHDKRPVMIAMRMRKTAFKNALKAAALGTKFTLIPTVTGHKTLAWPYEKGHINRQMLTRYLLGLNGPIYYLNNALGWASVGL